MAVKASATISIYRIKEVTSTTNYYLLQSSTAAAPSKPTTDSPGGKWTTSEPAYTDGSTLTLYTVIKTKYSDNTFEYTPVSKSTSYEAAKSAYNKAQAAQNSATSANNKINNLKIGGRNLFLKTKQFTKGNEFWSIHSAWKITQGVDYAEASTSMSGSTTSHWNRLIPHKYFSISDINEHDGVTISFDLKIDDTSVLNNGCICALQIWDATNTRIGWYEQANIITGSGYNKKISDITNGQWTRVSVYFTKNQLKTISTEGKTADDISYTNVSFQLVRNGSIHIRKVKAEWGNVATDWTPAPEDSDNVISQDTAPKDTSAVWFNTHDNLFYKYNGEDWIAVSDYNEDISKLKEDVGKIDSTIDGKINAYNEEIKNTYYTKAQVDSQIETNERGIKEYYSGTLQTIREDTTGLSNRITAIEGYIQKGLDDNGQPFVELGTQASPYKLKITNDAIQITYLGEPVSNWKQDLIELNTVITSYLNLGKFSFVINSDDSLSFRKIR